ncbi:MAG: hypothetical protein GF417_02370 [Candidatus Latescibacteria bacterium]|nr:hypothetical protein [bacterium]MBD3423274.1 hypothetical protein [Candidatus Latescibacterota bacterium]
MTKADRIAAPLLFIALGGLALILSLTRPMHNWDMVPYVAAAKAFEENDPGRIHSFTYSRLRASVPPEEYAALANPEGDDPDSVYRNIIASDPAALSQQLPLFQIRPLYTGAIYIMYRSGINIYLATHLIPGISVLAGMILLYIISALTLPRYFLYLVPAGAAVAGVLDLAKYSTPDGIALLMVILSGYLLLSRRIIPLLIILPVMIAARTDLIIFVLPLCTLLLAGGTAGKIKVCASALASILILLVINNYYSNPGWGSTFHTEFIRVNPYPLTSDTSLSAREYLEVLIRESGRLLPNKKFLLYLPAATLSLYLFLKRMGRQALAAPVPVTAITCLVYVVAHYLLFPDAHERFFAAQYLLGGVALLRAVKLTYISRTWNGKGE